MKKQEFKGRKEENRTDLTKKNEVGLVWFGLENKDTYLLMRKSLTKRNEVDLPWDNEDAFREAMESGLLLAN